MSEKPVDPSAPNVQPVGGANPGLGYVPHFPGEVQSHELAQVNERRKLVHGLESKGAAPNPPRPLEEDLFGLAFSGGGIRSATFNLGVLQALAALKLLTRIDYLSSVSGGGYIAGWLAAWIRREPNCRELPDGTRVEEAGVHNVQRQLDPSRIGQSDAHRPGSERGVARAEEPEPIHHLRAHGRYLSPRFGLLQLDSWVLVALYVRNLLANGLLFAFAALTLALVCRLLVQINTVPRPAADYDWLSWALVLVIGALLFVGQVAYRWFLADVRIRGRLRAGPSPATTRWVESGWVVTVGVALPCVLAAFLTIYAFGADPTRFPDGAAVTVPGDEGVTRLPQFFRITGTQQRSEVREWVSEHGRALAGIGLASGPFPPDNKYRLNARAEYVLFGAFFAAFGLIMFPVGNAIEWYRSGGWERLKKAADGPAASEKTNDGIFRTLGELFGWSPGSSGRSWGAWRRMLVASGAFGFTFGFLLCALRNNVVLPPDGAAVAPALPAAAFGVPLFLAALVLGAFVDTSICGPLLTEYEREWRSRAAALLLRVAAVWVGAFAVVVFVPWLLERDWAKIVAAVGGAAGSAAVYLFRNTGSGPSGTPRPSLWDRFGGWVLAVVPPLLLAGGVAAISYLSQNLPGCGPPDGTFLEQVDGRKVVGPSVPYPHLGAVAGWLFLVAVLGVLYAWLVHPNLFSLHSVYGNRLVRCYLGASRRKLGWGAPVARPVDRSPGAPTGVADSERTGNPFTGLSPRDDFSLLWLRVDPNGYPRTSEAVNAEPWKGARTPYTGPYPLFNATLNLIAGDELAYQDRKGASFVLTPDYCGSAATGYARVVPVEGGVTVTDPRALSLGRAITISGAAVDPNMRNYQSPGLTALLTLLNLRLGWWLQNPWTVSPGDGTRPWEADGPWSAAYLCREALGWTRADSDYVHLSDGGHFENTGAYELIRRRCRYVVVVDAAEDPADASENLANLIRLVRTDFGIPIDIDTSPLRKDAAGLSRWHCAVGSIRYDEVDQEDGVTGTLVFVRSSLTGDEPADVRNYAATHPPFPHHSTADQFFDEEQFESYRALGYHIGMSVFAGARAEVPDPSELDFDHYRGFNRRFFATVRRVWAPLPSGATEGYLRSCRDYLKAVGELRDRADLRRVSRSLFPEAGETSPASPPPTPAAIPPAGTPTGAPHPPGRTPTLPPGLSDIELTDLHAIDYLLQTMELAWLENDFDRFHAHPLNRGWMNVLRRWTMSDQFHDFWPILRAQYSRGFVRFCEVVLNLTRLPPCWCCVSKIGPVRLKEILTEFDREFGREWESVLNRKAPDEWAPKKFPPGKFLSTAIEEAQRKTAAAGRPQFPLAWVLTTGAVGQPPELSEWPDRAQPLGLVVVFDSEMGRDPAAGAERELLVWIRGAYRTLGLGRDILPELLDTIDDELKENNKRNEKDSKVTRLFVRYPRQEATQGDRTEVALWTWFFNDNDFRRNRGKSGERRFEVRLVRDIEPPNPQEPPRVAGREASPNETPPTSSPPAIAAPVNSAPPA